MYQANLPHILAKTSPLPSTIQDYNAALANAGNFLAAIEKAHATTCNKVAHSFSCVGVSLSAHGFAAGITGGKIITIVTNQFARSAAGFASADTCVLSLSNASSKCPSLDFAYFGWQGVEKAQATKLLFDLPDGTAKP
jgi:hypothetical protein